MLRAAPMMVLAAALLSGTGCSVLAKRTPTPAANLDADELAKMPEPPGVRHYLVLFGSQDWTRRPAYTHTWATLVRAVDNPAGGPPAITANTISWLPTKLDINALSRHIEPGTNVDLHDTIRNSLRTNQKIAMWGPYEVWHGFAYRFMMQKEFLESGAVGYQCIDVIGEAARTGTGSDCIHAITDMDPRYPRWRYPLAFYGQAATANLVRRIMHAPVTIGAPDTHDWIIPALGLNQYCIERREYNGRVVPYEPGEPGLQAAPALPIPLPRPAGPKVQPVPPSGVIPGPPPN
jgi:hypothetical protein